MESLHSPNEIPARVSSAGFGLAPKASKSVLRPLSEDNWMAGSKRPVHHTKSLSNGIVSSSSNGVGSSSSNGNGSSPSNGVTSPAASAASPEKPDKIEKEQERERRKSIGQNVILQRLAPWPADQENVLTAPYDYLAGHPGKDIRTALIAAFNAWLEVPPESLEVITRVIGKLHTASLLVDDVEDSSQLRRGFPVAHSIFGTAQTINSANYVYFCALRDLRQLKSASAIDIYTEELINLHRGQGMDLFWRDTLTCPTEDAYLEMVNNKTGGLFRLAIKLMQAESASDKDCVPLVNTIGLLFQVLDDYRNLSSSTYTASKGFAEDLTEGKFSFPVIHSIRADPANLVLLSILKQKTKDDEVKRYAIAYMERTASFSYTRKVLRDLLRRALVLVDGLEATDVEPGRGAALRQILERFKA